MSRRQHKSDKVYARELRQKRLQSGACTRCGGERDDWKMNTCATCRQYNREYAERQAERLKLSGASSGACSHCRKREAKHGTRCEVCFQRGNKIQRVMRHLAYAAEQFVFASESLSAARNRGQVDSTSEIDKARSVVESATKRMIVLAKEFRIARSKIVAVPPPQRKELNAA